VSRSVGKSRKSQSTSSIPPCALKSRRRVFSDSPRVSRSSIHLQPLLAEAAERIQLQLSCSFFFFFFFIFISVTQFSQDGCPSQYCTCIPGKLMFPIRLGDWIWLISESVRRWSWPKFISLTRAHSQSRVDPESRVPVCRGIYRRARLIVYYFGSLQGKHIDRVSLVCSI
jgi:hypothetical protein